MFNLNNVYACLHFDERMLALLVIEYKHGIPYYLHEHIENLKVDQSNNIFSNDEWEKKVKRVIEISEKKLGLKFTKLSVSINDALVSEIKTKEIKVINLALSNVESTTKSAYNKLQKYIKTKHLHNYIYSDAKLLQINDENNKNIPVDQVKIGTKISSVWKIVYCSKKPCDRIIKVIEDCGVDVANISVSSENLPQLIKSKSVENVIVVSVGKTQTKVLLVKGSAVIKQKNLDYSIDNMITYIKNECISKNVIFNENEIYKMLRQSAVIQKLGISDVKIFCETNDKFLSFNVIGTSDICEFYHRYTTRLINLVNTVADELITTSIDKTYVYFVFVDSFHRHILPKITNKLQNNNFKYHVLNFDLIVNTNQQLIFPFAAILNLIENQKMLNKYCYSIDPYYDRDYELVAVKKNQRINFNKTMNVLIQKIVK